ncbi:MAG: esterase-like activity of phytase family protein [Verrucomicrobia bacterium]|nr:esterase-like activity of phytase family protein [Verrucomicrobiota bacterium]
MLWVRQAHSLLPRTGTSAVGNWVGAKFPHITANLDFATDSSLRGRADVSLGGVGGSSNNAPNVATATLANLEVNSLNMIAKIAPYAIKTLNGQRIGFVGATTWDLLSKSSPNGAVPKDDANAATSDLQEVAAYVQAAVNALQALGVNKIVMVDQLDELQRNKNLAPLVSGIDIMVAGGGHERMGDSTDVPVGFNGHDADFIADAYPITTAGLDGRPTLIVTTDTEYTYLGRLVADFDADGVLVLPNLNPAINGAYASTEANLQTAYATLNSAATIIAGSTIGSQVKTIIDAINNVVVTKDGNVYGYTNVYLEGDRVFGRTQEVNLGNITADANAIKARAALGLGLGDAVFSLKNGGGIRASLGSVLANGTKVAPIANPLTGKLAGGISQLDIENALRFDNKLMVFDATPLGLKNILEFASGLSSGPTAQSGGYAQVGNIRFSYNSALTSGSRLRSAALVNEAGQIVAKIVENGAVLSTAPATIKCVALSFTANGGDSYPIKYLNPPTNTQINNETSNFRLLLTNGGLSAEITNRTLDFTAATTYTSLGLTAADVLGEQKAFQDFLAARHPSLATAYNTADTAVAFDTRIQQLAVRTDTVLSGPATFAAWLASNGFTGTLGGDSDSDGVPDSLEYFFNTSPNSGSDRANLPTVVMNGNDLEFRFAYLNSTVFTGFLQCSEDLITWVNATPGLDYEVITETVNGVQTAARYRIFCNPLPTTQGPFTYMTPFTASVGRGAIDQLTITNHGMVGAGRISGEALDSFGETQGAASGLSITGWSYNSGNGQFNGTFNVLPDRGYNSGAIYSNYAARIHTVPFTFTPYYGAGAVAQGQIVPTYSSTTKFTYLDGVTTKFTTGLNPTGISTIMSQSVGTVTAANGPGGAQTSMISFDAEAIHVFADGSGFVSDEYGTYIARFNAAKQFTRIIQLPVAAQPHSASGVRNFTSTTPEPISGRRVNQGLEGLAVSPDNKRLFALLQSATVQDTNGTQQQTRYNTRLFVYDIEAANLESPVLIGEYVVQLPRYDLNGNNSGLDVTAAQSEIVALSQTQILLLPRDGNGLGKSRAEPIVTKTVDLVDISTATNVLGQYDAEGNQISPLGVLRAGITPARSTVVINLLSSADLTKFGFNTNTTSPNQFTVAEKIEGMALVPDTSTSSTEDYFLFVANDNDFQSSDVRMLDATGAVVSYGDARSSVSGSPKITNDAVFTAWRISICPNNRKFFRIAVPTAP